MKPRRIDAPVPGYFVLRLVSGGAQVAGRIHRTCCCTVNGGDAQDAHPWDGTCDRYPRMEAEINGRPAEVDRVWTSGQDIDEAEYNYLIADREHARRHRPDSPEANPHQAIDFNVLQPPF